VLADQRRYVVGPHAVVVLIGSEVHTLMTIPNILALDVDGALCDGMREYGEARRSDMRGWGHIARRWPWREPVCRYVGRRVNLRHPLCPFAPCFLLERREVWWAA
jgi:hypothetical protein